MLMLITKAKIVNKDSPIAAALFGTLNKLNPNMMPGLGIEPGPRFWEVITRIIVSFWETAHLSLPKHNILPKVSLSKG